jgi:hypothetical protein
MDLTVKLDGSHRPAQFFWLAARCASRGRLVLRLYLPQA